MLYDDIKKYSVTGWVYFCVSRFRIVINSMEERYLHILTTPAPNAQRNPFSDSHEGSLRAWGCRENPSEPPQDASGGPGGSRGLSQTVPCDLLFHAPWQIHSRAEHPLVPATHCSLAPCISGGARNMLPVTGNELELPPQENASVPGSNSVVPLESFSFPCCSDPSVT